MTQTIEKSLLELVDIAEPLDGAGAVVVAQTVLRDTIAKGDQPSGNDLDRRGGGLRVDLVPPPRASAVR